MSRPEPPSDDRPVSALTFSAGEEQESWLTRDLSGPYGDNLFSLLGLIGFALVLMGCFLAQWATTFFFGVACVALFALRAYLKAPEPLALAPDKEIPPPPALSSKPLGPRFSAFVRRAIEARGRLQEAASFVWPAGSRSLTDTQQKAGELVEAVKRLAETGQMIESALSENSVDELAQRAEELAARTEQTGDPTARS